MLEIDAAGLWHEPLDLDDRIGAFVENIKGLLQEKVKGAAATSDGEDNLKVISNAISCLFGVAALSGNFDLICQALETVSTFDSSAP